MSDTLLSRFLRYVQIDTQSDETSKTFPSTSGQLVLLEMLNQELSELGAADVQMTKHGYVVASIPANTRKARVPTVAFLAHVDTAPDCSGKKVKPIVHRKYDGRVMKFPDKPGLTLDPATSPELRTAIGKDIVTASGTTIAKADQNFAGFRHIDTSGEPPEATQAAPDWGPVQTDKASIANLSPVLLPFFNNGPVFGLPGTVVGDFWQNTQLTGDWGGFRTSLAEHGIFFDLYSTSSYQDVASGGLKTGSSFVENLQLSINIDTGRAGLWPGGLFHFTVGSRFGDSAQNTFTAGSSVPQNTGLAFPGPFLDRGIYPTEYFLVQALTPQFSLLLGKLTIVNIADQTLFGDSAKYYFANLNFNKNPIALTFYNTHTIAGAGVWTPTKWLTIAGGVFDPNTQANNFDAHAFDKVNLYTAWIFSYTVGGLPGQFMPQYNWTNKPKIDLESPFGSLSLAQIPNAIGLLLGSPSNGNLPINYKSTTWGTIENISQYLYVTDDQATIAEKLKSGQPLNGVGMFARFGYSPPEASTVTVHGSLALFAHGLWEARKYDSFGAGYYYNAISNDLKNSIKRLTFNTASVNDEMGMEIFYDFAITPAIRFIPGYQHIWDPIAARVSKHENGADVFLSRVTVAF